MRKILSILLFVLPIFAAAQTQPPNQTWTGLLYEFKNTLRADSLFLLPRTDTVAFRQSLLAPGAMIYRPGDKSFYGFNGQYWVKFASDFHIFASNGLHLDGDTVKLGGTLQDNTVINTNGHMLNLIGNGSLPSTAISAKYDFSLTNNRPGWSGGYFRNSDREGVSVFNLVGDSSGVAGGLQLIGRDYVTDSISNYARKNTLYLVSGTTVDNLIVRATNGTAKVIQGIDSIDVTRAYADKFQVVQPQDLLSIANGSTTDSVLSTLNGRTRKVPANFLKSKMSQIFPFDSSYYVPPTDLFTGISNNFEIFNLGNFAKNSIPFQQTPIGIGRGNWSGLFTNNMILDTANGGRWNTWNTSYPASAVEVGWEGVTFHYTPHGYSSFTNYPHEGLQLRGGVDGVTAYDSDSQYVQLKTTMVGRYDTAFDAGSTAYGWGYSRKPFTWFFSEYPTKQGFGNEFSTFDQYYSGATSGPILSFKRSRGTYTSKSAVSSGDTLGNVNWYAHDGSVFRNTGRIYAVATANATSNNAPTAITTQASNGNATVGTATITSGGNFGINTTSPAGALHIVKQDFGGVIYMDRYNNTGTSLGPSLYGVAANGTIAAPTAIKRNDPLISIAGAGHDGTTLDRSVRGVVGISADADWTISSKPTRFDISLTHTIGDQGRVFSIDHLGNAGVGDTTDLSAKLFVQGNIKATAPVYSSGGFAYVVRNKNTGLYESRDSSLLAPATGSSAYINNSPGSVQPGYFQLNQSSSIVGSSNTYMQIGQTGATSTNIAGINIDGVNGDFAGLDYLQVQQQQNGNAFIKNNNGSGSLTMSSGGGVVAGSAISLQIATVTGNTTLNNTHTTVLVNNSGSVTITLPSASTNTGRLYVIKKISGASNDVVIAGTIDGVTNKTLTLQYSAIILQSNGASWFIISSHAAATAL